VVSADIDAPSLTRTRRTWQNSSSLLDAHRVTHLSSRLSCAARSGRHQLPHSTHTHPPPSAPAGAARSSRRTSEVAVRRCESLPLSTSQEVAGCRSPVNPAPERSPSGRRRTRSPPLVTEAASSKAGGLESHLRRGFGHVVDARDSVMTGNLAQPSDPCVVLHSPVSSPPLRTPPLGRSARGVRTTSHSMRCQPCCFCCCELLRIRSAQERVLSRWHP
jgi:hypothetical protein